MDIIWGGSLFTLLGLTLLLVSGIHQLRGE